VRLSTVDWAPVGYPEIQVRDASKNGTPVCIDAFTVLR